jgi:ABC-2 type transport system ATP-binding protein
MPAGQSPAVQVTDLTVRYGSGGEVTAVDGLHLAAHAGEVLVVLGPNGAGKTSTIESLEGYRKPSGGTISVLGLDPLGDHRQLTQLIGVMLQNGGVYPMLGPRRVLDLFSRYYATPLDTEELLDVVALRSVASTPWRNLSGGEQQRLALALALIGRPRVAFLDEPTAGVDPEGRLAIRQVVTDLRTQGVCVILTTHELIEAEKMADRIVIMSSGRVIVEGSPSELCSGEGANSVSFGSRAGLEVATLAGALGSGVTVSEVSSGRYRIEGASGPTATAVLATWLAERDATLNDLVTGRTLEDVYFDAVGAAALEQTESDSELSTGGGSTRGRRARRGRGQR